MRVIMVCVAVTAVLGAGVLARQGSPKTAPAQAPQSAARPITDSVKGYYDNLRTWITKSAEIMAEKDYAFHPATMPSPDKAEIRTFGGVIGHVAQENFIFCAAATGEKPPASSEGTDKKMAKADLQKALAESFAFCDKIWADTNDRNGASPATLPFGLGKSTRLGTLVFNSTHDAEHYGNIVTYLRAKGLVPPSSAPAK
jgi:uncharacterized damage-inducible protein DinB